MKKIKKGKKIYNPKYIIYYYKICKEIDIYRRKNIYIKKFYLYRE